MDGTASRRRGYGEQRLSVRYAYARCRTHAVTVDEILVSEGVIVRLLLAA